MRLGTAAAMDKSNVSERLILPHARKLAARSHRSNAGKGLADSRCFFRLCRPVAARRGRERNQMSTDNDFACRRTSLVCPECRELSRLKGAQRRFRCRNGHSYPIEVLLALKERRLGALGWTLSALERLETDLRSAAPGGLTTPLPALCPARLPARRSSVTTDPEVQRRNKLSAAMDPTLFASTQSHMHEIQRRYLGPPFSHRPLLPRLDGMSGPRAGNR